jgi:hypothetical protein
MFVLIQKEGNRYATQLMNKKKQEGPMKPKKFGNNHTHECIYASHLSGITGVGDQLFIPHMQLLLECFGIGSSCYNVPPV